MIKVVEVALINARIIFGSIMVLSCVQVMAGSAVIRLKIALSVVIAMRQMVVFQTTTNAQISAKGKSGIIMEPVVVIATVNILQLPALVVVIAMRQMVVFQIMPIVPLDILVTQIVIVLLLVQTLMGEISQGVLEALLELDRLIMIIALETVCQMV
jgi:hypothetical protein